MNTFGKIFRLTTAGESHGDCITGIIDGMPAGVTVNFDDLNKYVALRKPGSSSLTTSRNESDIVNVHSGVYEGRTIGTPIAFTVENSDQRSKDYEQLRHIYRPSHADYTYQAKYGVRDHRGGGRSSARETVARVVAGYFAMRALETSGVKVYAYTSQIGRVAMTTPRDHVDFDKIYCNDVRCPDAEAAAKMAQLVKRVREAGDTVGGIATGMVVGLPAGVGDPVYGKLQMLLASAMMSINAAKGFEYGMGFEGASRLGSEMNDIFTTGPDGNITTLTNHSGGIQGGISNGRSVYFRVAFKPVATLMREIRTVDDHGHSVVIQPSGRHDPCVLPRVIPVVQSMAAIAVLDAMLSHRCSRI